MEILKVGYLPPEKNDEYRGECEHCHGQVKVIMPDPAVLPYSRTNPEYKVMCPTPKCGHIIILEEYITRDCFVGRNVGQRA
jgi:hypothetical protein